MTKLSSLSVFFPCLNEAENVEALINDLISVSVRVADVYEIIVINDGSTDATAEIVERIARQNDCIRLVSHRQNLGYGASIRSGIKAATMEWIFFTDGDRQFDVRQLEDFAAKTHEGDVIIGYRKQRADGRMRSLNAYIFGRFVDLLFRLHVRDIDCAFKLIRASLIKDIDFISRGAMISTELLYRLKKKKITMIQLPVIHYPRKYGKPTGNNLGVILRALYESVALYCYMKFGWRW